MTEAPYLAAVRDELFEQFRSAVVKCVCERHNNRVVCAVTYLNLAVFDRRVGLHHVLVAIVVRNLIISEQAGQLKELAFDFAERALILLVLHIRAVYRVYNKHGSVFLSLCESGAEVVEVFVKLRKVALPRIVEGVVVRIVALSLTSFGIRSEVSAHEVDSVCVLYIGDSLQFCRSNVPSAAGEHFGDSFLLAELFAD